ncbi:uncharacterized protein LOC135306802 isoform X5 [Passer domesticus]|uniref:uncharacterized protein LOC135306802 isoform X5 n=1 Tax=Passer domesticus TaxID=48849 RepID=UPI0030FE76EA
MWIASCCEQLPDRTNVSQLLLPERHQQRVVPAPRNGDDAGSHAGVEEWTRCMNMEAAWLINDLKPAVKVEPGLNIFSPEPYEAGLQGCKLLEKWKKCTTRVRLTFVQGVC